MCRISHNASILGLRHIRAIVSILILDLKAGLLLHGSMCCLTEESQLQGLEASAISHFLGSEAPWLHLQSVDQAVRWEVLHQHPFFFFLVICSSPE